MFLLLENLLKKKNYNAINLNYGISKKNTVLFGIRRRFISNNPMENIKKKGFCKGLTKKNLQCKIRIDEQYSYCFFHKGQKDDSAKSIVVKQCCGITKSGLRCKKNIKISNNNIDYCFFHKKGNLQERKDTLDTTPDSNIRFLISKSFLEESQKKNKIIPKFAERRRRDPSSDDEIMIYPADPGSGEESEDIFSFIEEYKRKNKK